jgi:hypothetical protein
MTYEFFLINLLLYLFIAYYKLIKPIKRNLGFFNFFLLKKKPILAIETLRLNLYFYFWRKFTSKE